LKRRYIDNTAYQHLSSVKDYGCTLKEKSLVIPQSVVVVTVLPILIHATIITFALDDHLSIQKEVQLFVFS
jgi:hypothetical protein